MSTSTEAIAKHTFDRTSHHSLIKDIAKRFQCNVYLIFPSYFDMDDIADNIDQYNVEHYEEHKCYLIDKYILSENLPNRSVSIHYMYNWLEEKLGDKAGEFPGFRDDWGDDINFNNEVIREFAADTNLYDLYFDNFTLEIAQESVRFNSGYAYTNWWDFLRMLLPIDDNEMVLEMFMEHRKEINEVAKICGADAVYYYSESNSYLKISQGTSWDMKWKDIYKNLNRKIIKNHQILLSKYSKDYDYFYDLVTYYKYNEYKSPLLVIDDFQEIQSIDIINFRDEIQKPLF